MRCPCKRCPVLNRDPSHRHAQVTTRVLGSARSGLCYTGVLNKKPVPEVALFETRASLHPSGRYYRRCTIRVVPMEIMCADVQGRAVTLDGSAWHVLPSSGARTCLGPPTAALAAQEPDSAVTAQVPPMNTRAEGVRLRNVYMPCPRTKHCRCLCS